MKTNFPNVWQFLTIQGVTLATNTSEAKITPLREFLPCFQRQYQIHNPEMGRNESREVLVSATTPQSRPNSIHGFQPSLSSMTSVNQKIRASKKVATLFPHPQRVAKAITGGSKAQIQDVQTATFSSKQFRAIRKIGI